jgi:uncharacterized protein (UPF0335 family)
MAALQEDIDFVKAVVMLLKAIKGFEDETIRGDAVDWTSQILNEFRDADYDVKAMKEIVAGRRRTTTKV